MIASPHRLRKHADYQHVYRSGRKQYTRNMAFFYALREESFSAQPRATASTPGHHSTQAQPQSVSLQALAAVNDLSPSDAGSRIGLTVPKALGNAVVRNRIKRRMREAVRHALPLLGAPVDVVLHPRRVVLEMEFSQLRREVAGVFRTVQAACQRPVRTAAAKVPLP